MVKRMVWDPSWSTDRDPPSRGPDRLLVAAPDRRLSDDELERALRSIGVEIRGQNVPVGGVRPTRRRRASNHPHQG